MIKSLVFSLLLVQTFVGSASANDTLLFKISKDRIKVYNDNQMRYIRKSILIDSGWLALDYTLNNRLIHRGYYTDSTFEKQLYCHVYYDSAIGYRVGISCLDNDRLHGMSASFKENGDTLFRSTYNQTYLIESKDFRTGSITRYDTSALSIPEIESAFPGGAESWRDYLVNHMRYPREAYRNKIGGMVIVQFVIEKDGTVTNVTTIQHVNPLLDEEAIRLIKESPKWIPARKNGAPVKSFKRQSIIFSLSRQSR